MSVFSVPSIFTTRATPMGPRENKQLNIEAKLLIAEAESLGISYEIVPNTNVVRFQYQNHVEFMRGIVPSTNFSPGPRLCANKNVTRAMLNYAKLPMSKGFEVLGSDSIEYRQAVYNALKTPIVVKPATSSSGNTVRLNITSFQEMNDWLNFIFSKKEHTEIACVEETAVGEEYRLIATKEKMLAVMQRHAASVVGDGVSTIQTLIDKKNMDPLRNISEELYPKIAMDADMKRVIAKEGLSEQSIPAKDQKITLREVSNISAGGDAVDVTDIVHPSVAELAVKTVHALPGMSFVGIDFITTDITADQATQSHAIIEVNSAPSFAMHDMPMIGSKRFVSKEVILLMFPELRST